MRGTFLLNHTFFYSMGRQECTNAHQQHRGCNRSSDSSAITCKVEGNKLFSMSTGTGRRHNELKLQQRLVWTLVKTF